MQSLNGNLLVNSEYTADSREFSEAIKTEWRFLETPKTGRQFQLQYLIIELNHLQHRKNGVYIKLWY